MVDRTPEGATTGLVRCFDSIYDANHRALHAYFLGRTSDPEAALDLSQEAFLRVWRNVFKLRELTPQRQRYWLYAVAKNLVAAGLADKCEIQIAYAIGVAKPVSILVDSYGTGKLPDEKLSEIVEKHFDLRPAAIIRDLDLRRPIYRQVAAYGHFGRTDIELPWEQLDKVEALRKEI